MKWGKAEGFLLIVCVVFSLFVAAYHVRIASSPDSERSINIYAVDIGDSPSCWIGSDSAVRDGISAAINDAKTRTKVKLEGETINYEVVSSFSELEQLVNDPPESAVLINTHGETVPLPGRYFSPYVRVDSPANGASASGAVTVEAVVCAMSGSQLASSPLVEWRVHYALYPENYTGMTLVDAGNHRYRATINLLYTAEYEIEVSAYSVYGARADAYVIVQNYGSSQPPSHDSRVGFGHRFAMPLCPYLYTWNGTGFEADNNILLGLDSSCVDAYRVQKPLVRGVDGYYSLKLRENAEKVNFFDRTQLLAVDHGTNVNVGVAPDGTILTYGEPCPPSSALLDGLVNLAWWVGQPDERYHEFGDGEWLDVQFDGVNVSFGAKLVVRLCSDNRSVVSAQRFNESASWETVASVRSRAFWSTWVLNVSGLLPDSLGEYKLRLVFDGGCAVDSLGLDTTPEATVTVNEAKLVSVDDSSGVKATLGDLQDEDGVCAKLDHGVTFDLRYSLPPVDGSGLRRDFIFVAKGYYLERAVSSMLATGVQSYSESISVDWKDWFEKIENCCRTAGWVWANVAGYSFYYFGNNEYEAIRTPGYDSNCPREAGLKQFLNKDVACNYSDGHLADLGDDYEERNGFWETYHGFDGHRIVSASRPFTNGTELLWNMFVYRDEQDSSRSTATVVMNKTELGVACQPGIFVHNGFAEDVDRDGAKNTYADDWFKGYVATVLAIEEARSFIEVPTFQWRELIGVYGPSNHTVGFGLTMRAADRGQTWDDRGEYRYVRLLFNIGAGFPLTSIGGIGNYLFLSHADIDLPSVADVRYVIDRDNCGLDLGTDTQFMDDWRWFTVSTVVGTAGVYGLVLGPVLGALPLIKKHFDPTWKSDIGPQDHAWALGTWMDKNEDNQGTISFFVEIRMYQNGCHGTKAYSFDTSLASWIGVKSPLGVVNWRFGSLSTAIPLTFEANWTIT